MEAAGANRWACIDGNEAVARVAHALSEVVAIYPITPASPMGELADAWSAEGRPNLWGTVPEVVEMQSEAGAAGVLHGAALTGALATTFTSSQGLLLMLPTMFKVAGELEPAVLHVAARTVATHALSIFGDHSDVMAVRAAGFAMLASSSVQEAHDLALVAHAASLRSRVPFLHFFDGFRTSHEVAKVQLLDDDDLRALVDEDDVQAHRRRGLTPEHPVLRGSSQNPDVYFQSREASNPFYDAVPGIVQAAMDRLAGRTGRQYRLVDYTGHPRADRVLVLMGSAAGAAAETVDELNRQGQRVGLVTVRLYRPFPAAALAEVLPRTVRTVAVLDRTKEPGAAGEPLHQDVITALAAQVAEGTTRVPWLTPTRAAQWRRSRRHTGRQGGVGWRVVGGRYGLASKELTPAMLKGVFDELDQPRPRPRFTVGIVDDVTDLSVRPDPAFSTDRAELRAVLYGLASDGTVGASRATVKLVGEHTDRFAQGYFVYDSKKSGTVTVSHLRFGPDPIRSTYLVGEADLVACHQFGFLERVDVLAVARPGATVLLNSPHPADEVWGHLPREVQDEIVAKGLDLWVVDADRIAGELGLGRRVNTVLQMCFFALTDLVPADEAAALVKGDLAQRYAKQGADVVARNEAAVDRALDGLHRVAVPDVADAGAHRRPPVGAVTVGDMPDFVERVTARLLAGEGDRLPVSALPPDGTFPTGTARWEKRAIAREVPVWDPELCIDCGKCVVACPHAAIRMKVYEPAAIDGFPEGFPSKPFRSRELPGHHLTVQVAPDDCTGCGVCVEVCPAHRKDDPSHKSLALRPADGERERQRPLWELFGTIPALDPAALSPASIKGSQVREPLFEFSGACAGCGETPYLTLLSRLFGDRMVVANATGCSSIYGGNLPTTPWCANAQGHGPAWVNSLFEDDAEVGLGMLVAHERRVDEARRLLGELRPLLGDELVAEILGHVDDRDDAGVAAQRARVALLRERLAVLVTEGALHGDPTPTAPVVRRLGGLTGDLVRRSVWIVGGDGWAYDIGSGGLDHVLASGRDVNILVLDTQVYSNTGGQASKATPRGAVAKFAHAGKRTARKDLSLVAMSYGDVYVAQVALGGSDVQTVKALLEADAWPGPSLVVAYSSCPPAHGFAESQSMEHQRQAVRSGLWPLFRHHPGGAEDGGPSFRIDSHAPATPFADFAATEVRFATLARRDPAESQRLTALAQSDVDAGLRHLHEQLVEIERRHED